MLLAETAVERSTFLVEIAFFDDRGDATVPESASWTLTDGTGAVVNSRFNVPIENPGSRETIELGASDLVVQTERPRELRILTVKWIYDSGKTGKDEVRFYVRQLAGLRTMGA